MEKIYMIKRKKKHREEERIFVGSQKYCSNCNRPLKLVAINKVKWMWSCGNWKKNNLCKGLIEI